MKRIKLLFFFLGIILSVIWSCRDKTSVVLNESKKADVDLKGKSLKIVIIYDGAHLRESFNIMRDSFIKTMNNLLKDLGAQVKYQEFYTKDNIKTAQEIVEAIKEIQPDLVFAINGPSAFADINIAKRLTDAKYKFVSENCIPDKSGVIQSWEKPGGNITGVGLFFQMNSHLRLMKKLEPRAKKLIFFSWDRMEKLNEWFEQEIKRACKEEKIELVEFKLVSNIEDEIDFFKKYANRGREYFFMGGISAYVHRDGRPVSDIVESEIKWFRENANLPMIVYDETAIKYGLLGGASIIWDDLGAQLAEKGLLILKGENPGDIPWEYPRKYDIVINKKQADHLKIKIPQNILNAAYRIYIDYNGTVAAKN